MEWKFSKTLREWTKIPIIILTVQETDEDKVKRLIVERMIISPNLLVSSNYLLE